MRDGKATRQRLHREALRLFAEKGVAETTVRELAQAACIAEGTLYRHYESKDALVWDLFSTNYKAFAQRLTDGQKCHASFPAKMTAVVSIFCRFFDEQPLLFRFLMLAQHQALPLIENDEGNPVEVVQKMLADAMELGEIAARPPGLAATLVLGLVLQPAVGVVYGRVKPPLSQYEDTITQACLSVLKD
ncbi:MAG: TetR/AcrR family transcriptional regulator [Alphaproteobacteria bacterium]|nr:TetR/AcrR family transcriptional regulator [Alphaproteobacteria bacterium]